MVKNLSRRLFLSLLGGSFGAVLLAGCQGTQTAVSDFEVECGTSDIYTQEDMDSAIEAIMAEFSSWKGCTMKRIVYAGDQTATENLEYCNELRAEGAPEFDQAIVFLSDFHSPSEEDSKDTAWNPDSDYDGWQWYLGRTAGGAWQLLTWGYG